MDELCREFVQMERIAPTSPHNQRLSESLGWVVEPLVSLFLVQFITLLLVELQLYFVFALLPQPFQVCQDGPLFGEEKGNFGSWS